MSLDRSLSEGSCVAGWRWTTRVCNGMRCQGRAGVVSGPIRHHQRPQRQRLPQPTEKTKCARQPKGLAPDFDPHPSPHPISHASESISPLATERTCGILTTILSSVSVSCRSYLRFGGGGGFGWAAPRRAVCRSREACPNETRGGARARCKVSSARDAVVWTTLVPKPCWGRRGDSAWDSKCARAGWSRSEFCCIDFRAGCRDGGSMVGLVIAEYAHAGMLHAE